MVQLLQYFHRSLNPCRVLLTVLLGYSVKLKVLPFDEPRSIAPFHHCSEFVLYLPISTMESSFLSAVFLPLALFIIMLGMGLGLTLDDFK